MQARLPLQKFIKLLLLVLSCCSLSCQSAQEREAQLKKQREEKIWSADEIRSLNRSAYSRVLSTLGEPDEKTWWNPGFGVVQYRNIQIRSAISGDVAKYTLVLTIRENRVTELTL